MSYRFKEPARMDGPDEMRSSLGSGMNDPKISEPRMFGGMDSDKPSRDEMEGRFSKFDPSRGRRSAPFGRGGRRSSPPPRDKPFSDRSRDFGYGRDEIPSGRERSPLRGGYDDRFPDRFKKDDNPYPRRDEIARKEPTRPYLDEPYRDKFAGPEAHGRYEPPSSLSSRFEPADDQFKSRSYNYPPAPYKGFYKPDMMPKPNECEIIVVNKQQRVYAETVEQRMKNLGIQVDILFLKDEALLVQTIDDIARRGSLYAMVISPLNETHGSVTLNILYGTPQEHRNMPLDDALKLVARNFHDHIRSQRETMDRDKSDRGFYSGPFPPDQEIQFLLRVLADGRSISVAEIDTVIRYLTERRDRLKGTQGDRGSGVPGIGPTLPPDANVIPPVKPNDDDIAQKEQDLQNRIMNIISQGPPPGEISGSSAIGGNVGPNIPGMGPDMPGPRPSHQPGMGPNQPTMGHNMSGLGPNQPGMGPNRPGMGPNQPGPGPNSRPGPDQQGMGANRPGNLGPNQMGIGGPNRPGIGPNQPGMGTNQGMGSNQQNIGPAQSGMAKTQPPMGPNQNVNMPPGTGANQQPPASTYINFDNPSVQKALDSLMQSGPNLLKNITMGGGNPPTSQGMQDNSQMKMSPGGIGPQRPSGNMPEMGMGPQGNMGPPQGGGMGPPQGVGHLQNNMGPGGPVSSSGPNHFGPGQNQQGMYGSNPNMMGNMSRQPYMGHMGNQGMGNMGGGPRRY